MIKDKSIFIKNIYYMLSYAFTTLNQGGYEDVATEEFENMHNLFAAILAKGISRQLKQGLYREYLNREIALDKSLGKGFCIGHSYFCGRDICTDEWLHSIVDYDILPMLSEYWFDDANKLQRWENILQGVFQ